MKKLLLLFLLAAGLNSNAQRPPTEEALAMQYYQLGEFDKAAALFGKLFEQNKNDAYYDLYLTTLLKTKNYTAAEKIAKDMIKLQPTNSVYAVALGRVYLEAGKKTAADRIFQNTIDNLPKDEFKIREIANAFYRTESYDLAISAFLKGRKVMENEAVFTFDLLSIYRFKKDKEMLVQEYVSALATSPEMIFQAESAFSSVFESDSDYFALQGILLKKLQKSPDSEVYTELLIWQYLQLKDYEMALRQLIALDKRIKSDGAQLFNTANTFVANQAFDAAIKAYEYILTKGKESDYYLPARLELINTKYLLATTRKADAAAIADLSAQYDAILQEFGKTPRTVFALKRWANLQAYYLNAPEKAEAALEDALKIKGISTSEAGQIKLDLGDIYILTGQPWEAILVYEQVAKQFENSAAGNEANYRAARLSFYQGNFEYAKSQADVLKASTSQLIANDALNLSLLISDNVLTSQDSLALKMYADAEMLQFRNRIPQALSRLDSINIAYPGNKLNDDILMAKAKLFIKTGEFTHAVSALSKLTADFAESIWADDAIFMLGDLYENKLNDPVKAKTLYQQLITEHPGSMFTAEARKRFRNLRGDVL